MLLNKDKKIQALKDQINNLKKRPSSIYGSGHALSDSEKESVVKRENKWLKKGGCFILPFPRLKLIRK